MLAASHLRRPRSRARTSWVSNTRSVRTCSPGFAKPRPCPCGSPGSNPDPAGLRFPCWAGGRSRPPWYRPLIIGSRRLQRGPPGRRTFFRWPAWIATAVLCDGPRALDGDHGRRAFAEDRRSPGLASRRSLEDAVLALDPLEASPDVCASGAKHARVSRCVVEAVGAGAYPFLDADGTEFVRG